MFGNFRGMKYFLICLLSILWISSKGQYDEATLMANGINSIDIYGNGKNETAINCFTKVIELNPKNAIAFYQRGLVYTCEKRYKEAIEDFTKAIEINPKYAEAYINRGVTNHKLGNFNIAIDDYTKAIE